MPRSPIRLVHVTTVPSTLWAFFGGQIDFLRQRGYEVHAISSPGELLERFAGRERVPVHPLPLVRGVSPARDLLALLRLARRLRRLAPDIVHGHTPKAGLLSMLAGALARVPVRIYHLHGLRSERGGALERRWIAAGERLASRLAHRVLCVGPGLARAAEATGIVQPGRTKVLGRGSFNGVDARGRFDPAAYNGPAREGIRRSWGLPADALVLGFVGRLARDKGVEDLLAAWSVLRDREERLHLLLVGPEEPHDQLPAAAVRALAEDARVHATGAQWDMPPLYAAMDLLVLPSYREGFPVSLLEAAAMGLPVVATRALGCADAVEDGVTGLLVPLHDPAALAGAIRIYLEDPARRRRDGAAGRERALRDFQPQVIWEELEREYASLLGQGSYGSAA